MAQVPSVQVKTSGTCLTVQLSGAMDWETGPAFRERLLEEISPDQRCVVLDMSAVSFCDSAGLSVLLGAWQRAERDGAVLVLACVQPLLQRVLTMTGADTVLRMYDTVAEAENALLAGG
ncbi:STAS domain-containing protein [Streptomyces sp. ESR1.13]|uniref:STAS domain-containing protein n=1 Tax=unclassified Streptomyces TaxID=2593676 RepID=UPI004040EAB8